MLMEAMPVIPIYIYTSNNLVHPSVKNFTNNILNQANYREIYLQPEPTQEAL
jgi:oligopeptide transport system substrate-binding protein